ncbi:MAG: DUF397 domain-containing protein [Sciscionella sp.]
MNRDSARSALATATQWRKPSRSQGQNTCVEITDQLPDWVGIRDSKLGAASPILACTPTEFAALLDRLRTDHP